MKERPILFSAPMVRALLNGTKTQTRRIVKRQVTVLDCPYGFVGDRLWVRETWSHNGPDLETVRARHEDALGGVGETMGYGPYYRATDANPETLTWRPSIHMPRWASRILLEIVSVRVERLNDCSDLDALAEGCSHKEMRSGDCLASVYARLWESINGAGSWAANPWVWVIEFKRINID